MASKITVTGPVASKYDTFASDLATAGFSASKAIADVLAAEATLEAAKGAESVLTAEGLNVARYVAMTFASDGKWVTRGRKASTPERDACREYLAADGAKDATVAKRIQRFTAIGLLSFRFPQSSYKALAAKFDNDGATVCADAFTSGKWADAGKRKPGAPASTKGPKGGKDDAPKAPEAPAVTVDAIVKDTSAKTFANVLAGLDGILANVDKRTLTTAEREAFLAVMAKHGFAPALTASKSA